MEARDYRNFDIQIVRVDDHYLASVTSPSGQRAQCTFQCPFGDYQMKYYISEITRGQQPVRRGVESGPIAASKEMGTLMFSAMFSGDVRRELDSALDDLTTNRENGLRIRLDLTGAPELAPMPWEHLFHDGRHTFLALSPDTTLVRYVHAPEPIAVMQVQPPLRLLAMACSPEGYDKLDLASERQRLAEGLSRLVKAKMVEIDWLEENSLRALNSALTAKEYHIFHFVGHGAFVETGEGNEGVLLFEDEDHYAIPVPSEKLGWALRRSVKLAVINACEGAQGEIDDPSSGVASSLLLQGIPAVVAMQFQISDEAAVHFSHVFYGSLAMGLPIDAAVTNARRDVMFSFDNSAEWATPVLFMRSPNGKIFDVAIEQLDSGDSEVVQEQTMIVQDFSRQMDQNLGMDMSGLRQWWENRGSDILEDWIDRIPGGILPKASRQAGSLEEMYAEAMQAMKTEQWDAANRIFKRINERSPGYRDIAMRWRECIKQSELAKTYRHLVDAYARMDWRKVLNYCAEILQIERGYKDTERYYAEAARILGEPAPRPDSLPPPGPQKPKPPSLPPARRPPGRPTSLPDDRSRPKSRKPPSLPG